MKTIITNEYKMRRYINEETLKSIDDEDFNNWIEYLKEYANWILEDWGDWEGLNSNIINATNLTLIIDDEDYYVDVIFNFLEEEIRIDLDYSEDIEPDDESIDYDFN